MSDKAQCLTAAINKKTIPEGDQFGSSKEAVSRHTLEDLRGFGCKSHSVIFLSPFVRCNVLAGAFSRVAFSTPAQWNHGW